MQLKPQKGKGKEKIPGLGKRVPVVMEEELTLAESQLTCREQTGRKSGTMPVSLFHWPNPPGSQRGRGPVDRVHETQHPQTKSRAEKFRRWVWREQVKNIQMAF